MSGSRSGPAPADQQTVAQEYETLLQFMYLVPIGLLQLGDDGAIAMINPLAARLLLPVAPESDLSNLFDALGGVVPDLRHRVAQFGAAHGTICENLRVQLLPPRAGQPDPQMLDITLVRLGASRLMAVLTDSTQAFRRERLLRRTEAWFNALLTEATDYALLQLDAEGRIAQWNASIGRVTGLGAEQVRGRSLEAFYPADCITPDRIQDRLREADASGWSLDDSVMLRGDGSRFWGNTLISTLDQDGASPARPDAPHAGYALILRDVTAQRQAADGHRREALCDHLTGIANRRAFFETAEIELGRWKRRPRPMSLLMVDADHFKAVNDAHGHAVGDAVLRDLARCLQESVRGIDLVARLGGEEFAVLLPSVDPAEAARTAERLRARIAQRRVVAHGATVAYTVSIGVAGFEASMGGAQDWLQQADAALYRAKRGGRNRIEIAAAAAPADAA